MSWMTPLSRLHTLKIGSASMRERMNMALQLRTFSQSVEVARNLAFLSIFFWTMSADIDNETFDHWYVAVLTVTIHLIYSYF